MLNEKKHPRSVKHAVYAEAVDTPAAGPLLAFGFPVIAPQEELCKTFANLKKHCEML